MQMWFVRLVCNFKHHAQWEKRIASHFSTSLACFQDFTKFFIDECMCVCACSQTSTNCVVNVYVQIFEKGQNDKISRLAWWALANAANILSLAYSSLFFAYIYYLPVFLYMHEHTHICVCVDLDPIWTFALSLSVSLSLQSLFSYFWARISKIFVCLFKKCMFVAVWCVAIMVMLMEARSREWERRRRTWREDTKIPSFFADWAGG